LRDHLVGPVDAHHGAGRDARREVERDRAGTAADVEQVEAGLEAVEEVRRGVLRGAPLVAAQHRLVVPVGVRLGHAPIITPGRVARPGIDAASPGYDGAMSEFEELMTSVDYPMLVVTVRAANGDQDGCLVGFATQCSIDPAHYLVLLSKQNRTYELAQR